MTREEAVRYIDELLEQIRQEAPKPHTIDPKTKIWPITEWGLECGRGFVSSERFSRGTDRVIPRTNRSLTREFRKGAA